MAKPGKRKPAPAIKKKPGMTLAQKMGGPAAKAARPQAGQRQQKGGGGSGARHTILLKQMKDKTSRAWSSHNAPVEAIDALVGAYESELRRLNPGVAKLTYTAQDLHVYVDGLSDLSMLVRDAKTSQYAPHGKAWIKGQILSRLKAAA